MDADITSLLQSWEFDPDDQYRIIRARDGRKVLQVRQPLGIEQYELDGRPDGKRPFGKESVLHEIVDRLDGYDANSSVVDFSIDHDDFVRLQNEGILYYYRYLILFQMGDYVRTASDTAHNLQICELVEAYAEQAEDKRSILQYRPYILRMSAISKAMLSLEEDHRNDARRILTAAIDDIENMAAVETPTFQLERVRSLQYLRSALEQIKDAEPEPALDILERELSEAVAAEEYERAAAIRDRIRSFEQSDG